MRIRRWAFVTAGLYALSLAVLSAPLILGCFIEAEGLPNVFKSWWDDCCWFYGSWVYWAFVGGLTLLESALLLTPLQIVRRRPVRKRRWIPLAATAGLLMGLLVATGVLSIGEAIRLDQSLPGLALGAGGLGWVVWGIVFGRYAYNSDPQSAFARVVDRLICGSTVELLVAVPCHVYVRQRNECCAGLATFTGIATGLAVLLFAFGPGVFFLFAKRVEQLRGRPVRIHRHTRDALGWGIAAIAVLAAGVAAGSLSPRAFLVPILAQFSFVVMGGVACVHAVLSCLDEPRPWVRVGATCAGLSLFLSSWWWGLQGFHAILAR